MVLRLVPVKVGDFIETFSDRWNFLLSPLKTRRFSHTALGAFINITAYRAFIKSCLLKVMKRYERFLTALDLLPAKSYDEMLFYWCKNVHNFSQEATAGFLVQGFTAGGFLSISFFT